MRGGEAQAVNPTWNANKSAHRIREFTSTIAVQRIGVQLQAVDITELRVTGRTYDTTKLHLAWAVSLSAATLC
jgi:hypothetical protein